MCCWIRNWLSQHIANYSGVRLSLFSGWNIHSRTCQMSTSSGLIWKEFVQQLAWVRRLKTFHKLIWRYHSTLSIGRRNLRTDQEKTKCRIRYASIKRLDFDELQDDDVVGAAGLPWQLFPHVRRSWTNAIHQSSTAASAAATVAPEHYTWTTSVKDTKQTKKVRVVVQPGKKLNEERKGGKGYKRVRPIGEQGNVAKRIKGNYKFLFKKFIVV